VRTTGSCQGPGHQPPDTLDRALARTFGVPPAFFFDDYSDEQAGLLQDQVELLAMVRDLGVTPIQLCALLGVTPEVRQAIADLIATTERAEAERLSHDRDPAKACAKP